MELCNAYTELNDPFEQSLRFKDQEKDNEVIGNRKTKESEIVEAEYSYALEYGLPPTGGWGLGIDRLVMLLSRRLSIKVIIFLSIVTLLGGCVISYYETKIRY